MSDRIHKAAREGKYDEVQKLLKQGVPVDTTNEVSSRERCVKGEKEEEEEEEEEAKRPRQRSSDSNNEGG